MGKSGFDLIESNIVGKALTATTNMITDFTLPDEWPDDIFTFLQINFSLSESTAILIIRGGISYPVNNNAPVIGEVYRSIPIQKDEVVNIQLGTTQTALRFKVSLEQ